MNRRFAGWLVVVCMVCAGGSVARAAEQAGQPAKQQATSASSTSTPIQQSLSAGGSITALDLKPLAPSLKLTGADGKVWTLALDPQLTSIWQNGQIGKLDALEVGQQVKVRYTSKAGKNLVKSITIVQATTPAAAAPALSLTPPMAPAAATPMAKPMPTPAASPASTESRTSY